METCDAEGSSGGRGAISQIPIATRPDQNRIRRHAIVASAKKGFVSVELILEDSFKFLGRLLRCRQPSYLGGSVSLHSVVEEQRSGGGWKAKSYDRHV